MGIGDYAIISDIVSHRWRPLNARDFVSRNSLDEVPQGEGAVVVLPARHHADCADVLNRELARLPWCLLLLCGDEENLFPVARLSHPNLKVWQMMKRPGGDPNVYPLVNGYTPHVRFLKDVSEKFRDWCFAGQISHSRREQCEGVLKNMSGGVLLGTAGFTQGYPPEDYMRLMASAKVVPCPSGPVAPDTFRVYEALEAGCVPIVDGKAPIPYPDGYWQQVFGEVPFPIIQDWNDLPGVMAQELADWPANANRVGSWWLWQKRQMAYTLQAHLDRLGAPTGNSEPARGILDDQVTVLIPTSPGPIHPLTDIIDTTIKSVRFHFPEAEIILMCDGVRAEMEHRRAAYEEYTRRVIWKCQHEWHNVLPLVFQEHLHQAAMTRIVVERIVKTPLVAFVEQDAPIVCTNDYCSYDGILADTSRPIEWGGIFKTILDGQANLVRLYHRGDGIPPEHRYLTDGPATFNGVNFIRTRQFCARPHIAKTDFYRDLLTSKFSPNCRTMIEDVLHSVIQSYPWSVHKLLIYWPSDKEAQRSWHSDGRYWKGDSDPKWEELFVF